MMAKNQDAQLSHEKIKWKMKYDYMHAQMDRVHKGLEGIQNIIGLAERHDLDTLLFLQQSVNIMAALFKLKAVTIGLRGHDGKYRYEVMSGLRDEAWKFQRSVVYKEADFSDSPQYKGEMISKLTKIYLAEDKPFPEAEKEAYNRPLLLGIKRRSPEDWIEGDYLDVHIRGSNGSLLGWIEVMGTNDGKIPDVTTVKFLETFSVAIAKRIDAKKL